MSAEQWRKNVATLRLTLHMQKQNHSHAFTAKNVMNVTSDEWLAYGIEISARHLAFS